jgi:D-glycero-D-manno-heptose 1,7-bisphosphate phosphatase
MLSVAHASHRARLAAARPGRAAVFFDKDGTLVEDLPYNVEPARMRLAAGALLALQDLAAAGFRLVVVSNQPGIALGLYPESVLEPVERWLRETLAAHGVELAGAYWCPHHPQGLVPQYARACDCRKPEPGLLLRAAREHGLALRDSWIVGDVLDDVEAGHRAGCRAILLDNGHELQWSRSPLRTPDHAVASLRTAAALILGHTAVSAAAGRIAS